MDDLLAAAARRRPRHPFLVGDLGPLTFAAVEAAVARTAGGLAARGVGPGVRVGVWATNTPGTVVAAFAVARAGGSALLLNPRAVPAEAAAQVAETGARLVLGSGVSDLGAEVLDPSSLDGPPMTVSPAAPGDEALVVFTSGSTGRPKGVRLTRANLAASAAASAAHLGHGPDERWLAVMPLCHVGGFSILTRSAREATTVLLEPRFHPARTGHLLAAEATLASLVPTMLTRLLDLGVPDRLRVRGILVGGAAAPPGLLARAVDAGLPVLATYGMTETCSQVATTLPGADPTGPLAPLPGAELRIVDGRIEVRGPMVSPGYVGETRVGEWLRTGDLGELTREGRLRVLGRADDVIVTGGENVHPAVVEEALARLDGVGDVVVAGVPDPEWGERVAAAYTGPAEIEVVEKAARAVLAGFEVPRRWLRLDAVPLTPSGKPDRPAVRRLLSSE